MKVIVALLFSVTVFFAHEARAGIPIVYGSADKIVKVADLPQNEQYETKLDGKPTHFDIGYMYTKSHIMWIPYNTSNGKFVGYVDGDNYLELTPEDIQQITAQEKITLAGSYVSFWDKTGGRIVFGLIILLILYGIFSGSGKDKKPEEGPAAPMA
ncbi:hypothetical protein [Chitinophaga defluvii]|uniref:Uncharacterized protein n=1 Tax=Chitinophaga defluvii TaxID=3163343 RepID=A0ABV2T551_9BACT